MNICSHCGEVVPNDSRFCPFCGESISNTARPVSKNEERTDDTHFSERASAVYEKNSKYGKQKRRGKIIIPIVILSLIAVALAGINFYQYNKTAELIEQTNDLQNTITEKDNLISSHQNVINTQKKTISELRAENDNLYSENFRQWQSLNFYESYAVIVPDDGTYTFHVYGCEDLDTSRFWIYNSDLAKSYGYKACPKCIHENQ